MRVNLYVPPLDDVLESWGSRQYPLVQDRPHQVSGKESRLLLSTHQWHSFGLLLHYVTSLGLTFLIFKMRIGAIHLRELL